jgi:hypothetical protein
LFSPLAKVAALRLVPDRRRNWMRFQKGSIMKKQKEFDFNFFEAINRKATRGSYLGVFIAAICCLLLARSASATENVPHLAFAQWADVPLEGQFVAGLVYQESEAYHIWAQRTENSVKWKANGEDYGIDINQGFVSLQYGITKRWAVDLNVGYTTTGWRYFTDPSTGKQGAIHSTDGLMDTAFGVRYQIFREGEGDICWIPTLTFRAGGILPGTYDQNFAYAPGFRSASVEPELLAKKHFGWPGLGAYFDGLFRWNRTTGNDEYITTIGLFQQIKGWELDVGYRHAQAISGGDVVLNADQSVVYPRAVREINDSIEAGFSYTTSKKHIRYGFETRTTFDGSNTDRKFWFGGSIQIPFGGKDES